MSLMSCWCASLVERWAAVDDDPLLLCGCDDDVPCDDCAPLAYAGAVPS